MVLPAHTLDIVRYCSLEGLAVRGSLLFGLGFRNGFWILVVEIVAIIGLVTKVHPAIVVVVSVARSTDLSSTRQSIEERSHAIAMGLPAIRPRLYGKAGGAGQSVQPAN